MEICYDGTRYHGWQTQPGKVTIQETIEKALSVVLKSNLRIVGAGRTDAGVHALQQFAHFDYEGRLPRRFFDMINSILPHDIALNALYLSPDNLHARYDAKTRTYEYRVLTRKSAFLHAYALRVFKQLSVESLNYAAKIISSYRDFSCLSKKHGANKTGICIIFGANWRENRDGLVFTVSANRFLWGMVRAMVGLMLAFANGKLNDVQLRAIMESRYRPSIANSAPAKGLFLKSIEYPQNSFRLLANSLQPLIDSYDA
ncbi:MAG: tRNA pseudouridine(38-40) synthase TruA [Bacteroidia bacterium]|nr:tRNA pseudouridine(38-40) synthase TruA [Bacteroidia bacterium]MDW8334201.1 tRNA pseudouridine(38-40) synthase TruA [Bacteroidia bacterium]